MLSLYDYCRENDLKGILTRWDGRRNLPRRPQNIAWDSKRSVYWKCEHGHQWGSSPKTTIRKAGRCPTCAGIRLDPGVNDLASMHPELLEQWDTEKNLPLRPEKLRSRSIVIVWWKCRQGHTWQAAVFSRSQGADCPVCTGRTVLPGENDLATVFPQLARQWDQERNGALTPQQVSPYSNRAVWWRCGLGHSWHAAISTRAWGSDCPYCAGRKVLAGFNDLATRYPELAQTWDPVLNGALTPAMVTPGSHKKVWWRCPENHVWKAVVYSRTSDKRCGCPVCAGKVSQKNLGRYQVPLVPGGAEKAPE